MYVVTSHYIMVMVIYSILHWSLHNYAAHAADILTPSTVV